jgi:hypothetical protein
MSEQTDKTFQLSRLTKIQQKKNLFAQLLVL